MGYPYFWKYPYNYHTSPSRLELNFPEFSTGYLFGIPQIICDNHGEDQGGKVVNFVEDVMFAPKAGLKEIDGNRFVRQTSQINGFVRSRPESCFYE